MKPKIEDPVKYAINKVKRMKSKIIEPFIHSKIIESHGLYFIEVKSTSSRTKGAHAFITNMGKFKYEWDKIYTFKVTSMVRPQASGYDNLHTLRFKDMFGLIGTGFGSLNSYQELIDCDYIPFTVELIK